MPIDRGAGTATGRLRVLVADDSPVQLLFLEHALRALGHMPITARNGREAVERCITDAPDVVLLDLEMPVLDGIGACREIRAAPLGEQPGIVFVTATADENELAGCLEAGGDSFLSKPVSKGVLGAQLTSFARNRTLGRLVRQQADALMAHQARVDEELRVARSVFDRVMTYSDGALANVRVAQADVSSFAGDLVLSMESPSGVQYLFAGDCTGHGLPAALTAMPAASAFASAVRRGLDAGGILTTMNDRLAQALPDGYFVAAALVGYDPLHQMASIWNGGLPDLYIWRHGHGIVDTVSSMHPPLGALGSAETEFVPIWFRVEPGDRVLVHSDGVSESRSIDGPMFGEAGVRAAIARGDVAPFEAVQEALDALMCSSQDDDITIAELECLPRGTARTAAPATPAVAGRGPDIHRDASGRVLLEIEAAALRSIDPLAMASQLAQALPALADRGGDIQVVLTELIANAVQHGVLGLSSIDKQSPDGFANFYQEVRQRTAALRHGWVRIELAITTRVDHPVLSIRVSDSGEGFAPWEATTDNDQWYSGRGLQLVRELTDTVRVLDDGRTVEATLCLQGACV
ncbi:MAG: fused response regulator/phosphatase [Gemmatimonadota bacterium]|nr:fused response regulator/phosphatase [Gemmatimonadota bacterium]